MSLLPLVPVRSSPRLVCDWATVKSHVPTYCIAAIGTTTGILTLVLVGTRPELSLASIAPLHLRPAPHVVTAVSMKTAPPISISNPNSDQSIVTHRSSETLHSPLVDAPVTTPFGTVFTMLISGTSAFAALVFLCTLRNTSKSRLLEGVVVASSHSNVAMAAASGM